VHYIGLSIGGQSGQAFAIEHSDKLISTILCACSPSSGGVGDDTAVWARAVDTVSKANSVEPLADEVMTHFVTDAFKHRKPGRWQQIRDTVAATTPAGMIGGSQAILNYDFTAQIPSLRVPTLAVRGVEDPDAPAKAMQRLADLVPGCRLEQIADARHFCNIDQPDAFNRIMMGWFDQHRNLT
jgi:3-oxoadipate enol-lactonase